MKILVTGDRGYIGSVLVSKLLKSGYEVAGLDIGFADEDGAFKNNLNYLKVTKDIRDVNKKDLEGIDAIIHLSALSNDPIGEINPKLTNDINYKSTLKLARIAKKIGVKRFIFSSSCSVYGIAKTEWVDEKSVANPLTAYAKSKVLSEKNLIKLSSKNFCVAIMRNSTVYGFSPMFRNDLVVNNLVTCALALNKIKVLSDGSPWRPLIDVRDLSDIFIKFLEVDAKKINGRIVNVGFNENNFTVKEVVEKVHSALPKTEIVFTNEHGSDSRSYRVKFDILKKTFPNLVQKWPMNKSIKNMISNLKKLDFDKEDFESGRFTRISALKKLINDGKLDDNLRLQ